LLAEEYGVFLNVGGVKESFGDHNLEVKIRGLLKAKKQLGKPFFI